MFSEIIGLIKLWIVTRALVNPVIWILFLVLFTILLFVSAIFIRFKNGWISILCFILLEAAGIVSIISLTDRTVCTDDLRLDKGAVASCVDVTSNGIVIRKRFRTTTFPLLGLELPDSESVYFTSAKEFILQSRFSGNLYVHKSSVYPGVILLDSGFNNLNEELLKKGLGRVSIAAPQQYSSLQKEAVKNKRGMWEISAIQKRAPSLLEYSVTWLIFINSVCLALVITICLKRIIVKYDLQEGSQIDQGVSCSPSNLNSLLKKPQ